MAITYEPIATTTLSSAVSSITFSSIPATYTDLRVVLCHTGTNAGIQIGFTYNTDNSPSGTNYSMTTLYGYGSVASSYDSLSRNNILIDPLGLDTTIPHLLTYDIMSYTGSTYKTLLGTASEDNNGSGWVSITVGLWRSTAVINQIIMAIPVGTLSVGTTATLYGIKAA
jgi:hypothetical protein